MLEKQRHHLIVNIVDNEGFASVKALCTKLNASEATIRRDLMKLAKGNKIQKIRGGAQSLDVKVEKESRYKINSSLFHVDKEKHHKQKRKIAQKAVEMCQPGESIIINGGSSTFMMSEFLQFTQLKILTNSIALAQTLWETSNNLITLPGGEIYPTQGIILSAFDNDSIPNYHCTKMFMGTPAINELGVMESDTLLVRAEQKLLKQAQELVVLADNSKLGATSNFLVSHLTEVDCLITDDQADPKLLDLFRSKGINVVIC
jgi:DeoR family ulaG and ulaABCDEF operon transcriptional repressor